MKKGQLKYKTMITLNVKIENLAAMGGATPWVMPADETTRALLMFVTSGSIGIPLWRWEKETEPVLKALGWAWALAPLSDSLPNTKDEPRA